MPRPACLIALLLAAPALAAEETGGEKPPTYDDDVLPILRANCTGCHNNDKQEGGLNMLQFAALMQGGGSGEVITAGDGEFSYLYMLAAHESEPVMPPNGAKMAAADLATLKTWIDTGARENAGSKVKIKPKADLSLGAAPTGRPDGPPPMPPNPYEADAGNDAPPLPLDPIPVEGRVPGDRADAVVALAASPWAPLVAVGGEGQVTLFHAETLEPWGVLPFPEGRPQSLTFSANGRLLIAGGGRGAYRGLAVVWDVTTGARVAEAGEEPDAVLSADLSPDQSLVVLGTTSKRAKVLSVATGETVYAIDKPTDWALSVAFSPDGVLLAVGDRGGNVGLWEAASGLPYADLRGHKDAVTALSWRADSNLLASASLDGTVHLWNPEDGEVVRKLDVKGNGVEAVAFAADGTLATAARDGEVALWDANGKKVKAFPKRPDYALSVAVADEAVPDGDGKLRPRLFAGDWTGRVAALDPADGTVAGEFSPNPAPLADRIAAAEAELKTAAALADKAERARQAAAKAFAQAEEAKASTAAALTAATAGRTAAEKAKDESKAALTAARAEADSLKTAAAEAAEAVGTLADALAAAEQAAKEAGEPAEGDESPAADAVEAARAAVEAARVTSAKAAEAAQAAAAEAERLKAELDAAGARLTKFEAQVGPAKQATEAAAKAVEPAAKRKAEAEAAAKEPAAARDAAAARLARLKTAAERAGREAP